MTPEQTAIARAKAVTRDLLTNAREIIEDAQEQVRRNREARKVEPVNLYRAWGAKHVH